MNTRKLSKGMGDAIAKRTILRTKETGELETWTEVAHRVAVGNANLIKLREDPNVWKFQPGSFDEHIKIEQEILERHIANASLLMSGRHLQHGDETQIQRNMEVFTNCSTATTSFILFYLLLNGSGVGRAYDDDMCVVDWSFLPDLRVVLSTKHPDFIWGEDESLEEAQRKYKNAMFYTVEDSREGWAKVVEMLETMAFEKIYTNSLVIIDFSEVRQKGAPIHGMQNRPSSGPKATMKAIQNIYSIKKSGLDLWEQAMWIDHYLAECVLVGGARRSARMSTKYWKDEGIFDFINIKKGGFLWSSNNSITVDAEFWRQDTEYSQKVLQTALEAAYNDGTGEPGFINQDKLVQNDKDLETYFKGDYVGSKKFDVEEPSQILLAHIATIIKQKKYSQITNPCVIGSTKIAVADGRNAVTIEQLVKEGKNIPVYSADSKTGQVQIKMGRSPRKTKENAEVWKLKLDDGSELIATADHKVLTWDRGYIEIKDLEEGDSIVPFYSYVSNSRYRQIARSGEQVSNGYFYSKRQYRLIYEYHNGQIFATKQVHHTDENSLNDSIENLQLVDSHKHLSDHMKRNNPYYQMTDEWKNNFASHKAETNGKWINMTNEKLLEHGKKLFSRDGKINISNWSKYAKDNGLPQTLSNPARFGTFKNFVYQVVNNHKVVSCEFYGYSDVYNITVDDNHNYFVITSQEDDQAITSSGICVKNCGEVSLNMLGGYCVIADVVPYHADTKEDIVEAFKAATRALIRVNLMDSLYHSETHRTNRIGIGMTGIHEYAWKAFNFGFKDLIDEKKSKVFWDTIAEFSKIVKDEAKKYSEFLELNIPHTDTTIKPSGSVSKLFGLTEGAHLPSMKEFLRWVQFRGDDPLVQKYIDLGYPYRELKAYHGTIVIGFPTQPEICKLGMGDKLITAAQATPEEQYRWLLLLEKYWIKGCLDIDTGNQISYTLKYNPKIVSFEEFRKIITQWQSQVKCCAIMPQGDTSAYEYQPEEAIPIGKFVWLVEQIKDTEMTEDIDLEMLKCQSGNCPL